MSNNRSVVGALRQGGRLGQPEDPSAALSDLVCEIREQQKLLRDYLRRSVVTLDTIVWEHTTIPCTPGANTVSVDLQAQTAQVTLIEGIFMNLHVPDAASFPGVTHAFVQLDTDFFEFLAPESNQNAFPWQDVKTVLRSDSVRHAELVIGTVFPVGAVFSFGLYGRAVPATLGETLH